MSAILINRTDRCRRAWCGGGGGKSSPRRIIHATTDTTYGARHKRPADRRMNQKHESIHKRNGGCLRTQRSYGRAAPAFGEYPLLSYYARRPAKALRGPPRADVVRRPVGGANLRYTGNSGAPPKYCRRLRAHLFTIDYYPTFWPRGDVLILFPSLPRLRTIFPLEIPHKSKNDERRVVLLYYIWNLVDASPQRQFFPRAVFVTIGKITILLISHNFFRFIFATRNLVPDIKYNNVYSVGIFCKGASNSIIRPRTELFNRILNQTIWYDFKLSNTNRTFCSTSNEIRTMLTRYN